MDKLDGLWVREVQTMIVMFVDLELAVLFPQTYERPIEGDMRSQLNRILEYKRTNS